LNADSACNGGEPVELTANTGTIRSPGYDSSTYPNNANCQWLIKASAGEVRVIIILGRSTSYVGRP